MKPDDFTYFSKWLKDRTGLVLGTDKMYLIESRLTPLLRKWNMGSFDSMMAALRNRPREERVATAAKGKGAADVAALLIHGDAAAKFAYAPDFRDDVQFGVHVPR